MSYIIYRPEAAPAMFITNTILLTFNTILLFVPFLSFFCRLPSFTLLFSAPPCRYYIYMSITFFSTNIEQAPAAGLSPRAGSSFGTALFSAITPYSVTGIDPIPSRYHELRPDSGSCAPSEAEMV